LERPLIKAVVRLRKSYKEGQKDRGGDIYDADQRKEEILTKKKVKGKKTKKEK